MAQAAAMRTRPFVAAQLAAQRPRALPVACSAERQAPAQQQLARRSLLAGLALLAAGVPSGESMARGAGRWDGESSAIGSCELGDAGNDCRLNIIMKDKAEMASYDKAVTAKKKSGSVSGVPVAEMGDAYSRDTLALTDKVLAYAAFTDPADPARIKLVKELKGDLPVWVSRYARGGNARKVSARKIYVVADAISAHFANNGLGPFPKAKLAKLVSDVQAAIELVSEGK